jgi:hypothetical protein
MGGRSRIKTVNMQHSPGKRAIAKSVGRRRQKRSRIEKTANIGQRDGEILGQPSAVMEMDSTVTTIELRETGVAGAAEGFAHSIR